MVQGCVKHWFKLLFACFSPFWVFFWVFLESQIVCRGAAFCSLSGSQGFLKNKKRAFIFCLFMLENEKRKHEKMEKEQFKKRKTSAFWWL